VLVFVEPPSMDELMARLRGRATEDRDSMRQRIEAAYEEVKVKRIYDQIVVNDEVGKAAEALVRILDEPPSRAADAGDAPNRPT